MIVQFEQRDLILASNSGRSLDSYRAVFDSGRRRAIFLPAVAPVLLPPHAMRAILRTMKAGTSLTSFMRTYLSDKNTRCLLPKPCGLGRECAGNGSLLSSLASAPARESIAHPPEFVKRLVVLPTHCVQALDKPRRTAMIQMRAMSKNGERSHAWLRERNRGRVIG